MDRTAVILVNWNGWKDTIECLESFSGSWGGINFFIIDNASSDGSVSRIIEYCKDKRINYVATSADSLIDQFSLNNIITIIKNDSNAGFALANNQVLHFIFPLRVFRFAWLLNNDTTITENTLRYLKEKMESDPSLAFCGSVLLDYYKQQQVQCAGVNHFKYLGVSKLNLKNAPWEKVRLDPMLESSSQTYQNGASLLVNLEKLGNIGFLDEDFFLYSEEADWQIRASEKGYRSALAEKSVVYHKGSMSTSDKKHIFFYHYNRSAILLTRKHFGKVASLSASFSLLIITLIRSRFKPRSFGHGLKGIFKGWSRPLQINNE